MKRVLTKLASLIMQFKTHLNCGWMLVLAWSTFPASMSEGNFETYNRGPSQCPHMNTACCSEPKVNFLHPKEKWIVSFIFLLNSWHKGTVSWRKQAKAMLGNEWINIITMSLLHSVSTVCTLVMSLTKMDLWNKNKIFLASLFQRYFNHSSTSSLFTDNENHYIHSLV